MATLKSYTCSKCAGILMFDSDQEIFDCPFCGNRYDIVDFHAGEVLEQANACLKQEAFSAAKEKFGQILDNEPQNFDALLGNVLCVLNLDSAERLENSNNLSGRDLTGAKKAILSAKRLSSGAKADYFAKMISLIESYENIIRFEREKKELLSGDTRNELNQKLLSDFRKYRSDERWASLNGIPGLFKIMGVLIFVDVFVCLWAYLFNFKGIYLSFGLLIGAVILFFYWLSRKDKKHDEDFDPAYEYEKRLKNRILELDRTYTTAYRNMKDLMGEFAPEDKAPQVVSESVPASGNDKDAPKDVFCAKCGAMLGLDMGKRVYQCDHCGVAYGVSLFFGMPMEKALNSINAGNYKDAGLRFSSILMAEPSDFEALLGRVLCAGKWTKVSSISISDEIDEADLQSVRTLLEEDVQHASDKDKPYFRKMSELMSYFGPYRENGEQFELLNSKVTDMEVRADVYALAFEGANYDDDFKKKRQELVNKTFPAQVQKKKFEKEFNDILNSLVEERSASLLVK